MAKRKPPPPGQGSLFGPAGKRRAKLGVDRAIRRAQHQGLLDAQLDGALCAVARTLAEALDEAAAAGGDRWLLARLTSELRETLARLRLDPCARVVNQRDELAELVAQMANPDT